MKLWTVALLSTLCVPAFAGHERHADYVYAPVVEVRPIVRHVVVETPRRECWDEVTHRQLPSATPLRDAAPAIVGGVIGGVIGHELGNDRNRGALTVLGAAAGSAIAHERAERRGRFAPRRYQEVAVERCEIVYDRVTREHIEAYDVVYRYRGRTRVVRSDHAPGRRIRVARRHPHW